jgi:hypothetical protein
MKARMNVNIFKIRWPNGRRIGLEGWLFLGPFLLASFIVGYVLWLVIHLVVIWPVRGIAWLIRRFRSRHSLA